MTIIHDEANVIIPQFSFLMFIHKSINDFLCILVIFNCIIYICTFFYSVKVSVLLLLAMEIS